MNQKTGFSISVLVLSVLTAALANAGRMVGSARETILSGFLQAAVLTAVVLLSEGFWHIGNAPHRTAALALALAFAAELVQAAAQAQWAAQQEFRSMALVGILPLLLWAGWTLAPSSWNAPARVLWWFIFLGGMVCLLGLAGQMRWLRLLAEGPAQQPKGLLYAEYFAVPLLCPQEPPRRGLCLPWAAYAVQAGAALGMQLVFGGGAYPAQELLRAWSVGAFSRMDALLLLVWLGCAVYRICFLCAALRVCLYAALRAGKELAK